MFRVNFPASPVALLFATVVAVADDADSVRLLKLVGSDTGLCIEIEEPGAVAEFVLNPELASRFRQTELFGGWSQSRQHGDLEQARRYEQAPRYM